MAKKKTTPAALTVQQQPSGQVSLAEMMQQLTGAVPAVASVAHWGARVRWWLRTGITTFDRLMGDRRLHGMASGKLYMVNGLSGTGKTLTGLTIARSAQAAGWLPIYVDMERTIDDKVAIRAGVNPDIMGRIPSRKAIDDLLNGGKLFTIEDAFEAIEQCCIALRRMYPELPAVVIFDSVAASATKRSSQDSYETKGSHGDLARALSQGLRNLDPVFSDLDVSGFFLNQLRVDQRVTFGDNKYQSGGLAADYYPDVIMRLEPDAGPGRSSIVKDSAGVQVGEQIRARSTKSRLYPGKGTGVFRIMYAHGIDDVRSVVDTAIGFGLLKVAGGWIDGQDILGRYQGTNAFTDALRVDSAAFEELRRRVLMFEEKADDPPLSGPAGLLGGTASVTFNMSLPGQPAAQDPEKQE